MQDADDDDEMLGSGDEAREEEDDTDDDEGRALRDAAMEAEANGSDFGSDIADDIQVKAWPCTQSQRSTARQCSAVHDSNSKPQTCSTAVRLHATQYYYTQHSIIARNIVLLHTLRHQLLCGAFLQLSVEQLDEERARLRRANQVGCAPIADRLLYVAPLPRVPRMLLLLVPQWLRRTAVAADRSLSRPL